MKYNQGEQLSMFFIFKTIWKYKLRAIYKFKYMKELKCFYLN